MSHSKMGSWFYIACFSLFFAIVSANSVVHKDYKDSYELIENYVVELDEENWSQMLVGEWMVEFYAPWCPACKALEPVWKNFGRRMMLEVTDVRVGKVDVTDSPGLSGRFMVTALPTIYHVINGEFRQYKSPRDIDALDEFIVKKTWQKVDPISSWKSPTSIQMSVISQFFKMSQVLRGIHNKLMEDFGLPIWGSYLIFAIATIVLGAILGLIIVCLIDYIYPPKPIYHGKEKVKDGSGGFMQEKSSGDEETDENLKDDLVDEEEASESEELTTEEKDSKATPSSPNVRKRKPRKAD